MLRPALSLIFLLIWNWVMPVWAQTDLKQALERAQPQVSFTRTPPTDHAQSEPGPDYRLGVGDQLSVMIWNASVHLNYELAVSPQGEIVIPRLGVFLTKGISVSGLQSAIAHEVHRTQRERLQIRVILRQLRKVPILITGYVARPGHYYLPWGTPLLEALRHAGGVRDNGSVRHVRLSQSERQESLDLFGFHFQGRSQANPLLTQASEVYVPAVQSQVAWVGEVQQPGLYEILPGETAGQVLEWAGGLKASADHAGLQRAAGGLHARENPAFQPLNVKQTLQSGDLLYARPQLLTSLQPSVLMQGQVRQPGLQPWRQGLTLLEALEQSGGAQASADLSAIRLSRIGPQGRQEEIVNLQAFLNGQSLYNPELQPEDVLMVPETFFNIRNISELTTLILSTLGIVSVVVNLTRLGGS